MIALRTREELDALAVKMDWDRSDLDRLTTLMDLQAKSADPPRVNKLFLVISIALTALVLSVLAFGRVSKTDIELDAT
jgi:hypothetical protein